MDIGLRARSHAQKSRGVVATARVSADSVLKYLDPFGYVPSAASHRKSPAQSWQDSNLTERKNRFSYVVACLTEREEYSFGMDRNHPRVVLECQLIELFG